MSNEKENNEKEKKRTYNQRVIEVEHGSFTPIVFSAHWGYGREAQHFVTSLVSDFELRSHQNRFFTDPITCQL